MSHFCSSAFFSKYSQTPSSAFSAWEKPSGTVENANITGAKVDGGADNAKGKVTATNGDPCARVYEFRAFAADPATEE